VEVAFGFCTVAPLQPVKLAPAGGALAVIVTTAPLLPRPGPLPRPLTELIGREAELQAIHVHLQRARLVTLTGVGGIGKTHLAIEAAHMQERAFADGVAYVELAHITDPERVAQTIAAAIGIREETGRSLTAALMEALATHDLLLVLDNCEHLIDSCAHLVGTLLRACPHLRVLATSRQALGLTGEIILMAPPLATPSAPPPPLSTPDVARFAERYPAIRLFLDRVAAIQPSFALTNENLPAIAELCARLEGIPLALELAAARAGSLSIPDLLARIADRFGLLSRGDRTARPHHRTLRAMLDWSYDLLPEPEARLFRRLSIFAGGWTLEAAEQVCSAEGVLDLLTQLVEKSLAMAETEADGTTRYRMLETIREYAAEKLAQQGEAFQVRRAHLDYFLALVRALYEGRHGQGQPAYLQGVAREYDNLRAALRACELDPDGGETGLWLAGYLQDYWWIRGSLEEGTAFLDAALQRADAASCAPARAFALNGAGVLAWFQGRTEIAVTLLEESLTIRRTLGDRRQEAVALGNLGAICLDLEDYPRARAYQEEALAVFREQNLRRSIAIALTNLGSAALHQGDHACARQCYEEAIALRREQRDRRGVAISLCGLGQVYAELRAWQEAQRCYHEALALLRECDDRTNINIVLLSIGSALRQQEECDRATAPLIEALEICQETGDALIGSVLYELAQVFHAQRRSELAVTLLAASYASTRHHSTARLRKEREDRSQFRYQLSAQLGADVYEPAWAQGSALRLDEISRLLHQR
jgi:predicted ATPase